MTVYNVSPGQTSVGITLNSGDFETVSAGGTTVETTINAGGSLFVYSGGTAIPTTVAGSIGFFTDGGDATSTIVQNGAQFDVTYGGSASFTLVSGGSESVTDSGTALSTTVSGGFEILSSGGTASSTTVEYGGSENIEYGGTAIVTTLDGGRDLVASGSLAISTTVNGGGRENVLSGGDASGAVVNNGGIELVYDGGGLVDTMLNPGGAIDLPDLPFTSGGTATLNSGTDLLTVIEGSQGAHLQLAGNYAGEYFHLFPDGGGGTLITVDSVACYRRGTRLRTDRGEVVVEALRIGDLLLTRAGEARPIRWIGHRRVDCRRHKKPSRVWPVRIRAGAFNDDAPHSDLWLSPDHTVFVAGVLIPIRHLINSGTIAQVPQDHVTYYHVALPDYDLLLAEGLPAESYLDVGGRLDFDDAGMPIRLFPRFAPGGPGPRGCRCHVKMSAF